MSRGQQEFRTACFVADCLRQFARPEVLWSHFPAGENRSAITGERLKRMGLKRGWSDFIFILPGGAAAFLELKAPGGRLSPFQVAFKHAVTGLGCKYGVADSGEAAIRILQSWGIVGQTIRAVA